MESRGESRPVADRRERLRFDSHEEAHPADLILRARGGMISPQARRPVSEFPELDCVRHRLPAGVIAAIERRARELGVSADRVLVTTGLLTEDAYVRALAASLGVRFEPFESVPRQACPIDDFRLLQAASVGLLPLKVGDDLVLVVAPRGAAARRLFTLIGQSATLSKRIRLTSAERLGRFVARHGAGAIGYGAAESLRSSRPDLSAGAGISRPRTMWGIAGAVVSGTFFAPDLISSVMGVILAFIFLAWAGLRLFGAFVAGRRRSASTRLSDDQLPIYTIIVPLYREAAAVEGLVAALNALNYPPEKLEIKLVLEADDAQTLAALKTMRLGPPYELAIAPDIGPRTKPKALNVALPFVRGTFLTVYDAEDRPEPDQLRRALAAFLAQGDNLACVQARLTIDNTEDSWLTRVFTAEYAGLFDVFLPGLASRRLPLPLGGSSNHFRTAALRKVGGWDPYNVTEDADLGMRFARHGYVAGVIASTTYEEAPARLGPWLNQRTRWFKGWMQTWLVHMRSPLRLLRELGAAGFATLQLVVGGTVLSALVHPLFLATLLYRLMTGQLLATDGAAGVALVALYGASFISGYLSSALLGLMGLARRRLLSTAWVLLLVPVHWLLLSLAAWLALYDLLRNPYRWDKTEHGLARTSRIAADQISNPLAP